MFTTRTTRQNGGPRPVLLGGSARGGTSWALKVLDSHPSVCGCHEPFHQLTQNPALNSLFDRLKNGSSTDADASELMSCTTRACVETHKPPFFRKDFLLLPAWIRSAAWFGAKMLPMTAPVFRFLASAKLRSQHRLVIKNRQFPLLDRVLKTIGADALFLLRHPCGVVSSWLRGMRMGVMDDSSANPELIWSRYRGTIEPLGFTAQQIAGLSQAGLLAVNWLVDTLMIEDFKARGINTRVMVYERLVENPREEWGAVFEWLGLPLDPAVTNFLEQSSKPKFDLRSLLGQKYTYFSVQRSKQSPVAGWRKGLTDEEVNDILQVVEPHIDLQHYWPEVVVTRASTDQRLAASH